MKKIIIWTVTLAVALTLGAGALATDGSLDAIREKGTLILGLDDSFPPMGYRDENNEIVGFDIDLAREVCARLGVELALQPIEWSAKELELSGGNIDCIWNGMSRTPGREESMTLSMNYMNNVLALMVKDPAYQSKEDLAGKDVGLQAASSAEDVLTGEQYADYIATLKELRPYTDYTMAVLDLINDNLDAVAIDGTTASYFMTNGEYGDLFTIDNLADDWFCIGFRKEDVALRDAVDQTLTDLAKDGVLAEISVKWFGSDVTLVPAE